MKNIFGKFNIVDIIIVLGVIIALIIGIATTKHFRQTADKQIEATSPITFQVFLRGVTVTGQEFPVKSGDNTIFDAVVTITDTAKITKDGAVVGGNKIKMGLPVTLEGNNYKFNGTISDVRVKTDADIEDAGANNTVG